MTNSPGNDVKLYPGVRLDNRKVLCAPGPRAKKKRYNLDIEKF